MIYSRIFYDWPRSGSRHKRSSRSRFVYIFDFISQWNARKNSNAQIKAQVLILKSFYSSRSIVVYSIDLSLDPFEHGSCEDRNFCDAQFPSRMGNLSSAGSIVSIVSRFNTSPIVILTFISSTFRWCNRRKLVQFNTPTVTYTPSLTTRAVFYLHDPSRSLSPARDLHLIATSAFTASFFPSFPHSRIDRIANPKERRRNIAACFNSLNLINGRKERERVNFSFFFFFLIRASTRR